METWIRNLVMLCVLLVWGSFMMVTMFILKEVPSPFVWTVPGATYAVLVGRVPVSWQRNPSPVEPGDRQSERQRES